jgi:GNAT superfamily N-acetyltransferase
MSDIRLRPATGEDARNLWQWRNEPETRAASFSTEPIAYDDHVKWLATKLRDRDVFILIAIGQGEVEIGYVRLDVRGDAAEMSLSLDRAYRGRGLGASAIRAATEFVVKRARNSARDGARQAGERGVPRRVSRRGLRGGRRPDRSGFAGAGVAIMREERRGPLTDTHDG